VKGDGRTYQFREKTNEHYDGIAYRSLFATGTHQWQTLILPFDSFSASFRGKPVPGAPFYIRNKSGRLAFFWRTNKQDHFVLK